jgi:hypothetical protein
MLHSFLDLPIRRTLRGIALLRSHEFRGNRRKKGRAVSWPIINLLHSRVYRATLRCFGINPLTPNDLYRGRTAPLTSKFAFYIFIQQI